MRFVDVLTKKRNGQPLTTEEIEFFVNGYTEGTIPDYQASAFLMTIYYEGMTTEEQSALTKAMAASGDQLDLSAIEGVKVDKHSTGGVGDNVTLVVAALVAACGVPVAKMSGRGLGHTGGTVDKLESIDGFHIELDEQTFIRQVNEQKIAVVGQSGNLTPADKKIYALRDVTATVDSIPLIASSIMSKKIAAGADAIVLDVKVGSGAFMKTIEDAMTLAEAMTSIGRSVGRETVAILSNMDEPLGYAIGNALEVKEAIDVLRGEGPRDVRALSIALGAEMLVLGKQSSSTEEAKREIERAISDGRALSKFEDLIRAQGGDESVVRYPERLPKARYTQTIHAERSGYVTHIDAEMLGVAAMQLGAGRATKEDVIDVSVGIVLQKKVGDYVNKGEVLAVLHMNSEKVDNVQQLTLQAIQIGDKQVQKPSLIQAVIRK